MAQAAKGSLAELREECTRVRIAADADPEARRARIHRGRYLRSYTDGDGAWNLRVRDNPEVGAEIMAALAPIADRLFNAARADGRRVPLDAYAADALSHMAVAASAPVDLDGDAPADSDTTGDTARPPRWLRRALRARGSARYKIIVRVDLAALLRGYPTSGETCELVGFGPIAVSAIRDMIDTGDPFLAAVATKGHSIVGVAHLGRRANAFQQTALEWLYPACAVSGCPAQAFLENDHRVDWAKTHFKVFDWLDRLCHHHHLLKTRDNWALVAGAGKRAFVPPRRPPPPQPHRQQPHPVAWQRRLAGGPQHHRAESVGVERAIEVIHALRSPQPATHPLHVTVKLYTVLLDTSSGSATTGG